MTDDRPDTPDDPERPDADEAPAPPEDARPSGVRALLGRLRRRREDEPSPPDAPEVPSTDVAAEPAVPDAATEAPALPSTPAPSTSVSSSVTEQPPAPVATPTADAGGDVESESPATPTYAAPPTADPAPSDPAPSDPSPSDPAPSPLRGEGWGGGDLRPDTDAPPATTDPAPTAPATDSADPVAEPDTPEATPEPEPVAALATPWVDEEAPTAPAVVSLRRSLGFSAHLAVLTTLATAVVLSFLLIEPSPRWVLLLGAAAVTFGLDGTLRHTWREPFASGAETAPFLFVPALYMLAVPVVIEHNIPGELVLFVGLAAGLGFGALAWAETASVRPHAPEYARGRVIATAGAYVAGFSIFALTYVFEVDLPAALIAIALASTMLAVEVFREGEIDPLETLGFAAVTGVVMAEARFLLYYLPLDTYLAGLTLLLVFYLVTGLLHSHITRALGAVVAVEYGGIAATGVALVVFARAAGLA